VITCKLWFLIISEYLLIKRQFHINIFILYYHNITICVLYNIYCNILLYCHIISNIVYNEHDRPALFVNSKVDEINCRLRKVLFPRDSNRLLTWNKGSCQKRASGCKHDALTKGSRFLPRSSRNLRLTSRGTSRPNN
jgi:hypothetical protein